MRGDTRADSGEGRRYRQNAEKVERETLKRSPDARVASAAALLHGWWLSLVPKVYYGTVLYWSQNVETCRSRRLQKMEKTKQSPKQKDAFSPAITLSPVFGGHRAEAHMVAILFWGTAPCLGGAHVNII